MIDITGVILNFQKFLTNIADSLLAIDLYRGSDEWEELTEDAFNALVVNHLANKFGVSISQPYEFWGQSKREILVRLVSDGTMLVGVKTSSSGYQYFYEGVPQDTTAFEFSFVEFGNPSLSEEDPRALEYVIGFDEKERVICVKKEGCRFFVR